MSGKVQNKSYDLSNGQTYERPDELLADRVQRSGEPLAWNAPLVGEWFVGREGERLDLSEIRERAKSSVEKLRKQEQSKKLDGFTDADWNDTLQLMTPKPLDENQQGPYAHHGEKQVNLSLLDWERRAVANDGRIDVWEALEGIHYIRGNRGGMLGGQHFMRLALQRNEFVTCRKRMNREAATGKTGGGEPLCSTMPDQTFLGMDAFDIIARSLRLGEDDKLGLPLPTATDDLAYDGAFLTASGLLPAMARVGSLAPIRISGKEANNYRKAFVVNGIDTPVSKHFRYVEMVARGTGQPVIGVHTPTTGSVSLDIADAYEAKIHMNVEPAAIALANGLFEEIKNGREVQIIAHSKGGIITRDAIYVLTDKLRRLLRDKPEQVRKDALRGMLAMITIETFGAAVNMYPDGPNYFHTIDPDDGVADEIGLGSNDLPTADWFYNAGDRAKLHVFQEKDFKIPLRKAILLKHHHSFERYWRHRVDPFSKTPADLSVWEDAVSARSSLREIVLAKKLDRALWGDGDLNVAATLKLMAEASSTADINRLAIVYLRETDRDLSSVLAEAIECAKQLKQLTAADERALKAFLDRVPDLRKK